MPRTIASFIQAAPVRGDRGGGGVINGGGVAGMIGGGGARPGAFDTSLSIAAGNYLMGPRRASAIRHSKKLRGLLTRHRRTAVRPFAAHGRCQGSGILQTTSTERHA